MSHHPVEQIKSAIKATLPGARIILVGSAYYDEQIPGSDCDVVVLTGLPVRKSKKQTIVERLDRDGIKYDIHFIPKLFVLLGWKNIAGKDLDTGKEIRLRLTRKIRSEVLANRIKMAYYYYLNEEYGHSIVSLFRARVLPYAKTDRDIFSFAGNLKLLERIHGELSEEEYLLYKKALMNRAQAGGKVDEKKLLLAGINTMYLQARSNFFQLQHNLQYYVYALRKGSLNALVNYNKAITTALYHYMNKNPKESERQLSKLTTVTDLDEQLKEYARLGVLEVRN